MKYFSNNNKDKIIETEPILNTKRPALTQSPEMSISTLSNSDISPPNQNKIH